MPRRIVTLSILLVVLLGAASCRRPSQASSGSRKLTGVQIADRTKPATVMIVAEYEATVEVPQLEVDSEKLGTAMRKQLAAANTAFNVLLENPALYLAQNKRLRAHKKKIGSRGTGLIVTPDGYVVTNAHVVELSEQDLKKAFIEPVSEWVKTDVAQLETLVARIQPGSTVGDEAKDRMIRTLGAQYVKTARLSEPKREVYAVMGYTRSGADVQLEAKPCVIKKLGKPIPGKDVAVLKMQGSDFPTLSLAQSLADGEIRTGSELIVVGYPGAVTIEPSFSLPSRLESSMTIGHVSGVKDMADGWKVIQTDTAINRGNSGGPALNDKGQVVGLATFTIRETASDSQIQGLNFVIAVDVVNEFLNELNIKPSTSAFTRQYVQALEAYEAQRPAEALRLFRDLDASHPGSNAVREFIQRLAGGGGTTISKSPALEAPGANAANKTNARKSPGRPMVIFGLIAGVVVIVVVIVVMANRN